MYLCVAFSKRNIIFLAVLFLRSGFFLYIYFMRFTKDINNSNYSHNLKKDDRKLTAERLAIFANVRQYLKRFHPELPNGYEYTEGGMLLFLTRNIIVPGSNDDLLDRLHGE